jgi:hypothetical protein
MGFRGFLLAMVALSMSACDNLPSIQDSAGDYQGVVSTFQNGKERELLAQAKATQISGQEDSDAQSLEAREQSSLTLKIQVIPSGDSPFEIDADVTDNSLRISAPGLLPEPLTLTPGTEGCFQAPKPSPDRVCYDGTAFVIDFSSTLRGQLSLILQKAGLDGGAPLETPKSYSSDQLRDRGIGLSFDTRIEYEHVVQARLAAEAAHANLAPHFSFNTFFSLVSLDLTSLLRSIGDLAPFLLPTRWAKAHQAGQQATAETYAWYAMRGDAGTTTEGLAYAVMRDEKAVSIQQTQLQRITTYRDQVKGQEQLGLVPRGTSDEITSLVNATQLSITLMQETLSEEYTALALAAGFVNPHAISSVTPGSLPDPGSPDPIDESQLAQIAVLRSVELRQMDQLISEARSSRTERLYSWTDPSGDSSGALGFGLVDYVRTGNSQLEELEVRRDQLRAVQLQKVANAVTEASGSSKSYATAKSDLDLEETHLSRLLGDIQLGLSESVLTLINAFQARMKSELDVNNAQYAYYNAVTKVNRLSLSGPYANIDHP